MLKKYQLTLLFAVCAIAVIQGQSCLCSQQDEHRPQYWYKVTAPSGLVLRKGPDRTTAKIGAVPFDEEVLSCDNTGIRETIEEKTGEWLKVTWADKTGYLFSGFLTQIGDSERKVQMVIPDAGVDSEWECLQLSPEMQWQALVGTEKKHVRSEEEFGSRFSSIPLKIGKKKVDRYCEPDSTLTNGILNVSDEPFAIFAGFKLLKKVQNHVKKPAKLLPGEVITFSTQDPITKESKHYMISVEGNVIPNKNINNGALVNGYNAPIYSIENYKINLYEQTEIFSPNHSKTPWKHQKLVDKRVTAPNDSDTTDMDVYYIYFAGDLDGDNELDLILARLGGIGTSFKLYLSSTKLPGFILRYMAECSDTSC
ncbi:MAG: SH3 domain-containing protein [Saprospiraceae bacterium]|nr:SH3 domain-containing protein [Saprospiraceae bacterium]